MNILITGATGFLGSHLTERLLANNGLKVLTYSRGDPQDTLFDNLRVADFVFHLAGVNRSENHNAFRISNVQLTYDIVNFIQKNNLSTSVYFSSSIHSENVSEYGMSKLAAEVLLMNLEKSNRNKVIIHRLARIFGPKSRPNYNSVVATFCYAIANNLNFSISDPKNLIEVVYVYDWVNSMLELLNNTSGQIKFQLIPLVWETYAIFLSILNWALILNRVRSIQNYWLNCTQHIPTIRIYPAKLF